MLVLEQTFDIQGHTLLLRSPCGDDGEEVLRVFKTILSETPFLINEVEEIEFTVEQERDFLLSFNESKHSFMILAFLDGHYIGNCSLNGFSQSRFSHRAVIGIALLQQYCGLGIGSILFERVISLAKEMGLSQLELEVVATNKRAISLYKKFGFQIYGIYPNNKKYKDGTLVDSYWMMREL